MKNVIRSVAIMAAMVIGLSACGAKVEVPPAHVGKVLTKNGYAPNTIKPSKFRLPKCWTYCDKLVVMEANDTGFGETLTIFMPEDKLNLTVDVRGTLTIPTDNKTVNSIYDRVVSEPIHSQLAIIRAETVYRTYGQQALRGIVRSELTKYDIATIMSNRESISQNIHAALEKKLGSTNTPLKVSRFELADIQPPKVIVTAQEDAKRREIDIQKAEADAQVDMVKAERDLEVAKATRLVEREKAEAIAEQNRIAASSITPQLLAYRKLEVAERIYTELAKSSNTIIVPADSSGFSDINSDAVLAKMLGKELKK